MVARMPAKARASSAIVTDLALEFALNLIILTGGPLLYTGGPFSDKNGPPVKNARFKANAESDFL